MIITSNISCIFWDRIKNINYSSTNINRGSCWRYTHSESRSLGKMSIPPKCCQWIVAIHDDIDCHTVTAARNETVYLFCVKWLNTT